MNAQAMAQSETKKSFNWGFYLLWVILNALVWVGAAGVGRIVFARTYAVVIYTCHQPGFADRLVVCVDPDPKIAQGNWGKMADQY